MSDDTIDVMFFCLGNICRSPLAEGLFDHKLKERGLDQHFRVESSGTGSWHVGEPPDPGSQRVARERLGLDISNQRSQQLAPHHVEQFDYLVAMDSSNLRKAQRMASEDDELYLLREFEPSTNAKGRDVPDPYGGSGDQFELVFDIVDRCCDEFLDFLVREHQLG